ncbi:hypothetical protein GQ54DRAFT_258921 [Martensiomyces pterosporus]|nr:hypothetical protein GQ54DRAFT_258921 [Martensiomyces pterosporus]
MTSGPPLSTLDRVRHGILGKWAVVGHGFNIASIISSGFVIAAVIYCCFYKRALINRPSFRLSAWIAACDVIYSACGLCTFDNAFMSSLSEIQLRVVHWFMTASVVSFVFLTVCLGIHLVLTVLTHKSHIARPIQPWYEYISMFLGFFITHPILYMYRRMQWLPMSQVFHIVTDPSLYRRNSWLTEWAWVFAGTFFLLGVSIAVCNKMILSFTSTAKLTRLPEGDSQWDGETMSSITSQRIKEIRSVTIRITLYPLVPIFTQTWVLVASNLTICPMWLFVVANLVPATQGMINFLIFLMNPAWDNSRRKLLRRARPTDIERPVLKDTKIGYAQSDSSTAHLSPCYTKHSG